jgi:hypothetical protein
MFVNNSLYIDQLVNSRSRVAERDLEDKPTEFLEGYVASYEEGGALRKLAGTLSFGQAGENNIRYNVARQILQRRELEAMDDEELLQVVENEPGFFSSNRGYDRHREAERILDERTTPRSMSPIPLDLSGGDK